MNKERFTWLLTDLYEKYNPENIKYVDDLVKRYTDSPFSAVEAIFFKYNHPSFPHFDPVKSTDDFKVQLIKDYENGKRTFKDADIMSEAVQIKEKTQSDILKEKEKNIEELDSRISQAHNKQKEELTKFLEDKINSFKETIAQISNDKKKEESEIDYSVQVNYNEEEVILPNKKHLSNLGINSRIIARTKSGKPVGLVIKDIVYDSFSLEDKLMVSIFLDKG